jgi:hypothetical protein
MRRDIDASRVVGGSAFRYLSHSMSGDETRAPGSADVRKNQKLAAVREALRRDTGNGDTVDVLTALVDAIDGYRSDTATRASTR